MDTEDLEQKINAISDLLRVDLAVKLRSYVSEILGSLTDKERQLVRAKLLDGVTLDSVVTQRVREWMTSNIDRVVQAAWARVQPQIDQKVGEAIGRLMPEVIEAEVKKRGPAMSQQVILTALKSWARSLP